MRATERTERKLSALQNAEMLADQLQRNEREHSDLLERRGETCRALKRTGVSVVDIMEVFGLSRSRVQQILRD
ncbi:hypothetical protein [Brachybacterium sp. NPDC056505]|uniref:hypothetical protein n=1 Tax=Brachybacterium sp. NPDC056505 TaxID=3345843 RepID=UPI0036717B79